MATSGTTYCFASAEIELTRKFEPQDVDFIGQNPQIAPVSNFALR